MLGECRRIFANAGQHRGAPREFNGLDGRAAVSSAPSGRPAAAWALRRLRAGRGPAGNRQAPQLAIEAMAMVDRPVEAAAGRRRHAARQPRGPCRGARRQPTASASSARSATMAAGAAMPSALAVAYVPFDEDFGYVTLEAFLARKPVITASDSGGTAGVRGRRRQRRSRRRRRRAVAAVAINQYAANRGAGGQPHGDARPRQGGRCELGRRDREAGGRLVATLIIQIPCLNEAETLPGTLRGPAAQPAGHRPHRGPRHRRRVARRHR